ncbi:MAG: 50S ribosomal protein L19 [Nitrospirae bacterium]|nr:50S ribosomal protein L19 [Candidatus Troglogloeales bacterium]
MNQLQKLEESFLKPNVPQLKIGQTVKVSLKIVEGEKERIQVFEGIMIGMKGVGHRQTFTVRKISYGVGVERMFPLHSPSIQRVEVVREGEVNRAKLYFLRERSGRSARLSEKKREIVDAKKEPTPILVPSISDQIEEENPVPVESVK